MKSHSLPAETTRALVRRYALPALLFACLLLAGCAPFRSVISFAGVQSTAIVPDTGPLVELSLPTATAASTSTPSPTPTNTPVPISPATQVAANCTYSIYYWREHPDVWLAENLVIGRLSYTKSEALAILNEVSDSAHDRALRQFIAAALNILKGADDTSIEKVVVQTSLWLNQHPASSPLTAAEIAQGLEFTTALESYNSGITGPGLCKDEPPTLTPTATETATPTPTYTPRPTHPRPTEVPLETPDNGRPPAPTAEVPPTSTEPPPTARPTEPPTVGPTVAPTRQPTNTPVPSPQPTPTSPPEIIPTALLPTLPPLPLPFP